LVVEIHSFKNGHFLYVMGKIENPRMAITIYIRNSNHVNMLTSLNNIPKIAATNGGVIWEAFFRNPLSQIFGGVPKRHTFRGFDSLLALPKNARANNEQDHKKWATF
jgi:hypothetical protein